MYSYLNWSFYTQSHTCTEKASIWLLPFLLLNKFFKIQGKFLNKSKWKTFKMLVESENEIQYKEVELRPEFLGIFNICLQTYCFSKPKEYGPLLDIQKHHFKFKRFNPIRPCILEYNSTLALSLASHWDPKFHHVKSQKKTPVGWRVLVPQLLILLSLGLTLPSPVIVLGWVSGIVYFLN